MLNKKQQIFFILSILSGFDTGMPNRLQNYAFLSKAATHLRIFYFKLCNISQIYCLKLSDQYFFPVIDIDAGCRICHFLALQRVVFVS